MKILYTGVRFENYDPKRRHSFEYVNFWKTFATMPGVMAIEYPYDRILEIGGGQATAQARQQYNDELWELVAREKPDVLFAFMYTDELDPATLARIKNETGTKTVAWFADDYWRFFNYSKFWPPYFHYVVTTSSQAVEWYRSAGFSNVLLSQWACNTKDFQPVRTADGKPLPKDIGVSFVGQKKSGRVKIVEELRHAGVEVECFGFGWPNGKLSGDEMLKVFSRSKICLNLTDRKSIWDPAVLGRIVAKKSVNRVVPDLVHIIDNFRAWRHFPILHTHARPFELAGCGAFVISGWSEDVEKYYSANKEMVFYRNPAELAEKIKYYLAHDAEREAIARAGYERTIKEHTYEARFRELFVEMGF